MEATLQTEVMVLVMAIQKIKLGFPDRLTQLLLRKENGKGGEGLGRIGVEEIEYYD